MVLSYDLCELLVVVESTRVKRMKFLIVLITLIIAPVSFAKEKCDLASIGLDESTSHIEQLFYTGTCHYRNKDYALSVESWERLSQLEPHNTAEKQLKVDVLSNLGFMKFYGLGTRKDQALALSLWKESIAIGHEEAEYHLCHAYADSKESTYHLENARKHCQKAHSIYKSQDHADVAILSEIEFYLESIQ